jgi:hypothetical protein
MLLKKGMKIGKIEIIYVVKDPPPSETFTDCTIKRLIEMTGDIMKFIHITFESNGKEYFFVGTRTGFGADRYTIWAFDMKNALEIIDMFKDTPEDVVEVI